MLDFPHEYETSASMMTAIKCQDDRVGERGARAEWIWECWQDRWKFRPDSEVWGENLLISLHVNLRLTDISIVCPLPSLSTLLDNPTIRGTDSFVICVQIHCPFGCVPSA